MLTLNMIKLLFPIKSQSYHWLHIYWTRHKTEKWALLLRSSEAATAQCLSSLVLEVPSTASTETLPQSPSSNTTSVKVVSPDGTRYYSSCPPPQCYTRHSISNSFLTLLLSIVICSPTGNLPARLYLLWAKDLHLSSYTAESSMVASL